MKSTVSVLIILNFVLSAHVSQESIPLKYLTKLASDLPTLQQRVVKRQISVPTPEDRAICEAKLKDALCTFGIEQGWVEAGLSCNRNTIEEAQIVANSCIKGVGGQFCGSLLELYGRRAIYIDRNCSSVLSLNSCPSNCRFLLEDFRSTFGCCINAYVNGSRYSFGATSLDYRVWNLCDVPLPPAACGNGPTINLPGNVQNCTNEDIFNKYYTENFCLPERRQAYTDVLESKTCGDMYSAITASEVNETCSVDTNGVPCGISYYRSLEDLARLDLACSTSNVNCTSNCRDGIIAAKKQYGCCFRSSWFNISESSYLSRSVLQSCNIELPGACEGLIGSAVYTMKKTYILLIVTGLMCLQLIV